MSTTLLDRSLPAQRSKATTSDHQEAIPKELRFGVIGAERRGQVALYAHQPSLGTRLVSACSLNVERISGMRDKCGPGLKLTTDYRELLADAEVDAVFICTPDHLHEEHALAAIEAGKHIFLEKPIAITVQGCDRILKAAREAGVKIYVGHNMRFFPVMRKLKELIDGGAIGQVQAIWCRHFVSYGGDAYFRDWHAERRYTNGLLLQKGAHDIDMIHWFGGAYAKRVVAMGKLSVYDKLPRRGPNEPAPAVSLRNHENWPAAKTGGYNPTIDVEDHSMVLFQLENGVQASYTQCHYTPDDQRNYTIIGTEGRIENYGDYSRPEKWATVHLWNRRSGYMEQGHEVHRIPPIEGSHGGADPLIVEDFIAYLRGRKTVGANPMDARMAVAAACLATESLRDGNRAMDIPRF